MLLPNPDQDPRQIPGETRVEYPTLDVNWTRPDNMQAGALVFPVVEKRQNHG